MPARAAIPAVVAGVGALATLVIHLAVIHSEGEPRAADVLGAFSIGALLLMPALCALYAAPRASS